MTRVIEAANQIKALQIDQQAAIDNVRLQYFKLQQANDKHEFLQANQYIKYDLLELQELMVKAGYVHPDEILESSNESVLDDVATTEIGMQRASQIFLDHVVNINQELLSPQYSQFYEAAEASSESPKETI